MDQVESLLKRIASRKLDSASLKHYGTKGMKWGIKTKVKVSSGDQTPSNKKSQGSGSGAPPKTQRYQNRQDGPPRRSQLNDRTRNTFDKPVSRGSSNFKRGESVFQKVMVNVATNVAVKLAVKAAGPTADLLGHNLALYVAEKKGLALSKDLAENAARVVRKAANG